MSNLLDKKNDTFGMLAAVKTVTSSYPILDNLSDYATVNGGVNVSIDYLLSLLNLIGVTKDDIITFLCRLLTCDKIYDIPNSKFENVGNGILGAIEHIIKAALLVNCKNMFSGCQVNPIIPDYLLAHVNGGPIYGSKGIDFNINNLDTFGVLTNCPVDKDGSLFYFDTKPTVYTDASGNSTNYNVTDVWKSMDFNAFLWYVINKGNNSAGEHHKNVWDNRYKHIKKFKNEPNVRDAFFNAQYTGSSTPMEPVISGSNFKITKEPYLICDYSEFAGNNESNIIKVMLPAERYYRTGMKAINYGNNAHFNKTIFEFNYDYIYSLKLFDTKTLITNIINSLTNLASSININVQLNTQMEYLRSKVSQMVDDVMAEESDEDYADRGCVKSFSNMKYDELLKQSDRKHASEIYKQGNVEFNYESLKSKIRAIDTVENLADQHDKQIDVVKSIINEMCDTITHYNYDSSLAITAQYDVISNFLKQTVIEIVMQLVSPKVMLLFAINQAVMGDVVSDIKDMERGTYVFSAVDIIEDMTNMIHEIIKDIVNLLTAQLLQFLYEKLKPMLLLFTNELLLETIRNYKDLIHNIMTHCMFDSGFMVGYQGLENNVNYADIVPQQKTPPNNDC